VYQKNRDDKRILLIQIIRKNIRIIYYPDSF
jgi:hypothetical protein